MIKIHVNRTDYNLQVSVQLYRDYTNQMTYVKSLDFASISKDQRLMFKRIEDKNNDGFYKADELPVLFRCDEFVFREIVQAFMDYAKKEKIESKSESYCEGKLSAIENHLEDMRKIVFFKQEYKEPEK